LTVLHANTMNAMMRALVLAEYLLLLSWIWKKADAREKESRFARLLWESSTWLERYFLTLTNVWLTCVLQWLWCNQTLSFTLFCGQKYIRSIDAEWNKQRIVITVSQVCIGKCTSVWAFISFPFHGGRLISSINKNLSSPARFGHDSTDSNV
jgi:hypothetical protein